MHIRYDDYFRDYFLESIDHMSGIEGFAMVYPNPSFGPDQRYLSKGAYVVPLSTLAAAGASVSQRTGWIVP